MNIVNLTPHAVVILGDNGTANLYRIEPSGQVARIATEKQETGAIRPDGGLFDITVWETQVVGEPLCNPVENGKVNMSVRLPFPPQVPDTVYIVSGIFRLYFDRPDLYQPGELVRDKTGQPIGCIGLSR